MGKGRAAEFVSLSSNSISTGRALWPEEMPDLAQQPVRIRPGFISISAHPASIAFSRAPASACADSAITEIARVRGSFFSRRVASQPSITGRSRSVGIRNPACARGRRGAALFAVLRDQHFELIQQLEPHLEHVDVVVVVFDVEKSWSRHGFRAAAGAAVAGNETADARNELGGVKGFLDQDRWDSRN